MVSRRVRAVWDLDMPEIREFAGVHEYDGAVMDLSPSGVGAALARLGPTGRDEHVSDLHDESHLAAYEQGLEASFGTAEFHRWNPLPHLSNLDVSCYDREYAPAAERQAAKAAHLSRWPEAIGASLESLDAIPAPVAEALIGPVAGLADGIDPDETAALSAHARLLKELRPARGGERTPGRRPRRRHARGALGDGEGMPIDLGRLETRADAERGRLLALLEESCARISPGAKRG